MAGGISANNIASWNGSAWDSLGSGFNSRVLALHSYGTLLYAGGWFTASGSMPVSHIASWNGTSWSALGAGTDNYVYAITDFNNDIYAGGTFLNAGTVSAQYVAHWVLPTAIPGAVAVSSSVSIYPIPFSEEATLVINSGLKIQNAELVAYDITGKEVLNLPVTNHQVRIQKGTMQSGLYFYKVFSTGGIISAGKFIVE